MTPLADLIHAALARLFPRAIRSSSTARHHRAPGRPHMHTVAATLARTARERIELAERTKAHHRALDSLRAECDRMAQLLTGVRRGRADAARFAHAVSRTKATLRAPGARLRFSAAPARFVNVSRATRTAVRTAGRESVAVAARAARQVGAHRHVKGVNDAAHDLAASALASLKTYARTRANGENSPWRQGMRTA